MRRVLACAVVMAFAPAAADPARPAKGFWRALVQPGARWVLHDKLPGSRDALAIETYDVRKVGGAEIARLRWTFDDGTRHRDVGPTAAGGGFRQLAVSAAGLYLLPADLDGARLAAALRGAPTHADPPATVDATAQTHNRYLHVADGGLACFGEAPPDAGCDGEYGSCDGELCVAGDGIVSVSGRWAPGDTTFHR
jgi:hypothetical protein